MNNECVLSIMDTIIATVMCGKRLFQLRAVSGMAKTIDGKVTKVIGGKQFQGKVPCHRRYRQCNLSYVDRRDMCNIILRW